MAKYASFIVLDIETTGFDPKIDDVIEFSAVKLNDSGQVIEQLDLLLSANQAVSPLVQSLTGITPEMLAGKPTLAEAQQQIEAFILDLPIVGHNINFDLDFLVAKGFSIPGDRLDTLELAQTILPAQPGYGLEQLSHRWGFPHQPSHRAMNDVLATVDLLLFLVSKAAGTNPATKKHLLALLEGRGWGWEWVFGSDAANFVSVPTNENIVTEYTDYLAEDEKSFAANVGTLTAAATGKINLIETHLPADPLAQALCFANQHQPSLLIIPGGLVRQVKWQTLSGQTQLKLRTFNVVEQQLLLSEPDLHLILSTAEEVTPALLRLTIKIVLWLADWAKAPDSLFLVSDEYYEWEQKVLTSSSPEQFSLDAEGTWVVTPDQLLKVSNIADFQLVSAHPHNLEESFFDTQTRTFSIPYFNAAISSRRDFIHREIVPAMPKVADDLFKTLSFIGPRFAKLAEILAKAYQDNPPTNVFDKDIELSRQLLSSDYDQTMAEVVDGFQQYLDKLLSAGLAPENHHLARTQKLLDHLAALRHFDPGYKYFLYSEPNRFFLQIIPSQNIFTKLSQIFDSARKVTVISTGLIFKGSFAYWQLLFAGANAKLITGNTRQLMQASDTSGENFSDVISLVTKSVASQKNLLLVQGSAYDSRTLFDDLHRQLPQIAQSIFSLDTIGLVDKLVAEQNPKGIVVIVPLYWLERAATALGAFDLVVINKIAFESGNKPIAKLYRGSSSSFSSYTLPKTTLRLKENLHYLCRYAGPIVLMDNRLNDPSKDYGQDILASLSGWQVIPTNFSEIMSNI